jgi:MraZ protein
VLRVRCQVTATLDDKGRLALPAVLRRALGDAAVESLVLTFHQGAVWGWTPEDFERDIERPLSEQDPFHPQVLQFSRALLAPAQDVEVDRQGRLRVPPMLRELAGLDREVVVNSLVNRIEIWDKVRWEDHFRRCLDAVPGLDGMPRTRP